MTEQHPCTTDNRLDYSLAAHIAHLFVRDPLVIFDDAVVLDDETAMVSGSRDQQSHAGSTDPSPSAPSPTFCPGCLLHTHTPPYPLSSSSPLILPPAPLSFLS